jgi:hypothetical protein
MSERYGFRRANSTVAHIPGWVWRFGDEDSLCGRVPYLEADIWSMQDGFDPDGTVRLCVSCERDLRMLVEHRTEMLAAWETAA